MPSEASSSSDLVNSQPSPEQEVNSILFDACRTGDLQTLKMLLEKDSVSVNQEYEGQTLLILAIKEKKYEIVSFLLQHKDIDPNQMDDQKYTPLMYSSMVNDPQIFDWLLSHEKIDVAKKGIYDCTVLHHASAYDQIEMVQKLVNHDPTIVDLMETYEHQPPLYFACITAGIEIVEILLQYGGAQLNCLNEAICEAFEASDLLTKDFSNLQEYNAEQRAQVESFISHFEECYGTFSLDTIITSLLKVIFKQDLGSLLDLQRILHHACLYGAWDVFKLCLEKEDIDINKIAEGQMYFAGETPLTSACGAVKDSGFINFLLSLPNIDINKNNNRAKSPLYKACEACLSNDTESNTHHLQVVLRLLKAPEISVTEDIIEWLFSTLESTQEKIQNNAKKILSALLIKNLIPESKISQIEALELYKNWHQFKIEHLDKVSNLQQLCFQAIQKHQIKKPHFFPKPVLEENQNYLEDILNQFIEWGGLKPSSNTQALQPG